MTKSVHVVIIYYDDMTGFHWSIVYIDLWMVLLKLIALFFFSLRGENMDVSRRVNFWSATSDLYLLILLVWRVCLNALILELLVWFEKCFQCKIKIAQYIYQYKATVNFLYGFVKILMAEDSKVKIIFKNCVFNKKECKLNEKNDSPITQNLG